MEQVWSITSVLCLLAAGILLLLGRESAAFVVAALGAVAWFLGYRVKLRATLPEPADEDDDVFEDEDEK